MYSLSFLRRRVPLVGVEGEEEEEEEVKPAVVVFGVVAAVLLAESRPGRPHSLSGPIGVKMSYRGAKEQQESIN